MALLFTDGFDHYEAGELVFNDRPPKTDEPPFIRCGCGKSRIIVEGTVLLASFKFGCCGSATADWYSEYPPDRWVESKK